MMEDLIYKVEKEGDVVILGLIVDNILMQQNEELQRVFTELVDEGAKNIVLDFSKTDFISSIVLASLVFMLKRTKEVGGNLVLCGIREKVRKILALMNLDKVLNICENRQKAIAQFKPKT